MSNISKTAKGLKKKLSFEDYERPIHKETEEPTHAQTIPDVSSVAILQSKKPIKKHKATFYLDALAYEELTEVFIKYLQLRQKIDKSALVSHAIALLYKQEMGK